MVLSPALPVVSNTFDEVGATACVLNLEGLLQPHKHCSGLRVQGASKMVCKEREGYSDYSRPKNVHIGPVVRALEQFSRMQREREQTLVAKSIISFSLPDKF